MTLSTNDPSSFANRYNALGNSKTDLIQGLLYEIIRVKELIRYYEQIPNSAGNLGASILTELVSEAYNSLINYDTELISKYYELLQNCD